MKQYIIVLYGKEVIITQNDDGTFNKPKEILDYVGIGTATKPAHEPICMARKPLAEKTVTENCLKYGTGGINIDESRVGLNGEKLAMDKGASWGYAQKDGKWYRNDTGEIAKDYKPMSESWENTSGRFPANLIHDGSEEVIECFPESKSGSLKVGGSGGTHFSVCGENMQKRTIKAGIEASSGNASRFFKSIVYNAKASKSDRGKGNTHATVKPTALMEYLIKMVTREGQTVLDPFAGSFTTAIACENTNRKWIAIEKEEDYFKIGVTRIKNYETRNTGIDGEDEMVNKGT